MVKIQAQSGKKEVLNGGSGPAPCHRTSCNSYPCCRSLAPPRPKSLPLTWQFTPLNVADSGRTPNAIRAYSICHSPVSHLEYARIAFGVRSQNAIKNAGKQALPPICRPFCAPRSLTDDARERWRNRPDRGLSDSPYSGCGPVGNNGTALP